MSVRTASGASVVALLLLESACGSPDPTGAPSPSVVTVTKTVEVPLAQPCRDPGRGTCKGPLAAGVYVTALFTPRLAYEVPSGWDNFDDDFDTFGLRPIGRDEDAGIYVFKNVAAAAQNEACSERPEPGVGTSPREMADWFTNHPGFETDRPVPVEVGNLQGLTFDLRMADGWTKTCPFSEGEPYVPLISAGAEPHPPYHVHWSIGAAARMRLWLVTLPDGTTAMIEIEAPSEDEWEDLLFEAESIVRSFMFAT